VADASKIYSHDVEANIDERIVKPLIDMNFDVVDGKYPQFRCKALTAKEKQAQFDTYINGVNSKALTKSREDENFLRKRLEVRARRSPTVWRKHTGAACSSTPTRQTQITSLSHN
jgi:hypothetical protein